MQIQKDISDERKLAPNSDISEKQHQLPQSQEKTPIATLHFSTDHLTTLQICVLVGFVISALMTWVLWANGVFFELPHAITERLPRPVVMLAILWLHYIPLLLLPNRDGRRCCVEGCE